jgi:hypothetical protein
MKTITYHCDTCQKEFTGAMSVYLSNEIQVNEKMETRQVAKEEHFCPECTEKIKKAIQECQNKKKT